MATSIRLEKAPIGDEEFEKLLEIDATMEWEFYKLNFTVYTNV